MYQIKPIISSDMHIIEHPTSMYKVKSIYADDPIENHKNNLNACNTSSADVSQNSSKYPSLDIVQQIDNILKQSSDTNMEQLELRQKVILLQLKELKERLKSMELKIGSKPAQPKQVQLTTSQKPIDSANLRDIVINASPNNVPFSLVILKKLWSKRLSLTIQFYTHSTISSLSQSAIDFQNQCTNHELTTAQNLNVSLIWKKVNSIEMINGSSSPVIGESNILRYLARIGPNEFNYESNGSDCNEIDGQLDLSELLIAAATSKERQVILKNLNTKLGKNEFFGGVTPAINDFSLASAILQSVADKELPPVLLKWSRKVTNCEI